MEMEITESALGMLNTYIGVNEKMQKITIEHRETIVVPICGEGGKEKSRRWLWEYLKETDQIATSVKHYTDKIIAETICIKEKEF